MATDSVMIYSPTFWHRVWIRLGFGYPARPRLANEPNGVTLPGKAGQDTEITAVDAIYSDSVIKLDRITIIRLLISRTLIIRMTTYTQHSPGSTKGVAAVGSVPPGWKPDATMTPYRS